MNYPPPFVSLSVDFDNNEPSITVETACDIHHLTIAEARTAAEHLETLADIAAAEQAAMGYASGE